MRKLIITQPSTQDKEQIHNMLSDLEGKYLNKREFNKIFKENITDQNIFYLAAYLNKNIVAFASMHIQKLLHHTGKIAELQEIYVSPSVRGKGIGKILINKMKLIAKNKGCKNLEVTCNIRRKDTHKFYLREGLNQTHYKFVTIL